MRDLLFGGIGWTGLAITLNRIAVGAFFTLAGYHKLFNADRYRLVVDELKALGVPALSFNQMVGAVGRVHRRRRRPYRALGATRRAWQNALVHGRKDKSTESEVALS